MVFLAGPMGHSKVEKAKTHQRIVAIASKRCGEKGLAGVGIAEANEASRSYGGRLLQALRIA
jgi:TetR/AcrR family transcriptional repressor of nem operon